jgi:hypothetical protein
MRRSQVLALVLLAASTTVSAQETGYRIRVSYDGTAGPHVLPSTRTCPGATPRNGAIVVEGSVYGDESLIAEDGVASYMGCGDATWDVDVCDLKDAGDQGHRHCVTGISGTGKMKIEVTINSDRDGAYIQMEPIPGTVNLTAGGTCDSTMTAEVKQLHSTETEVADIESVPAGKLRVGGNYRSGAGDNNWLLLVLPDAVDPGGYPGGPNDPCPGPGIVPYPRDPADREEDPLEPLDPSADEDALNELDPSADEDPE